jgi:hypothetical protein
LSSQSLNSSASTGSLLSDISSTMGIVDFIKWKADVRRSPSNHRVESSPHSRGAQHVLSRQNLVSLMKFQIIIIMRAGDINFIFYFVRAARIVRSVASKT